MMIKSKWTGVDLFSGVGGMSLGFEQAGIEVAVAVDFEEINAQTYSTNFPHTHFIHADINNLKGKQIQAVVDGPIHVLFGGSPCQGFSLIGKRRADDPRNDLIFEFARMVSELHPYFFVVENVKGITQGSAVSYLHNFIRRVEEVGYSVVAPICILDASNFGVPQRRERVFILGYAKDLLPPFYPEPITDPMSKVTVWDAISDLPDLELYPELLLNDVFKGNLGKPSRYAALLRGEWQESEDLFTNKPVQDTGLSGCLRTTHTPETIQRFDSVRPGSVDKVSRFQRLQKDGLAPTLRAGTGKDKGSFMAARPIHPIQPRCISVREAARLHSFPDWFQFHPTKWHGFRQIGNSVPPFLARHVARKIVEALELTSI